MAVEDYLSVMKVLPDPVGSFMQGRQDSANLQTTNLQNQTQQFALQQAQQQQQAQAQQQAQYQQAVAGFIQSPTAEAAANLSLKFPAQQKAISDAWNMRDKAVNDADRQQLANVYSLLNNGFTDQAKSLLQQRQQADQAAGKSEPMVDALLQTIDQNPDHAKGVAAYALASIPGGEDFAKVLDKVGAGDSDGSVVVNQGGALVKKSTGEVLYQAGSEPKYEKIKDAQGNEHLIEIPQSVTGASAASSSSAGGQFDAKKFFHDFTLPHEGGYAAHDANGSPVNMGVNQAANPGVDVRNLTSDQAADIFAKKYAAKAANLPAPLAAAYADTAYINPTRADQFLAQSGGDVNKFLSLRQTWQKSLVAKEPAKYGPYAKAWANRNRDLAAYVNGQGAQTPGRPANIPSGARDITPASVGGGDPASSGPFGLPPDAAGPQALQALPAPVQARVQQLLDGRSILTAREKGTPYGRQLMDAANLVDPLYDEGAAKARMTARSQFSGNGKAAILMGSANRLAAHLALLNQASEQLVGPNLGSSTLNHYLAGAGQTFQPAALKQYNSALPLVADELEKIARGSSGSVHGIEQTMKNLSASASLKERRAAIRTVVELVNGAVDPIQQQWGSAFQGSYKPPIPMGISPAAQHVFDTVGKTPVKQGGQQALPVVTPQQAASLPAGTRFKTTDGRVMVKR